MCIRDRLGTRRAAKRQTSATGTRLHRNRFQVRPTTQVTPSAAGYAGYIPGIASENVYGETYGKTSYASSAQTFHRGVDQPANLKYNTSMKSQFTDHAQTKHDTVAATVGVERGPEVYKKVRSVSCFNRLNLFVTAGGPNDN